jgi:hypothetical protein
MMVVDGRYHGLMAGGSNNAMAATWLLLDTYVTGDWLATGN